MASIVRRGKRKDVEVATGEPWVTTTTLPLPASEQDHPGFIKYGNAPVYCLSLSRGMMGETHVLYLTESEMLDTVEKWLAAFNQRRHQLEAKGNAA